MIVWLWLWLEVRGIANRRWKRRRKRAEAAGTAWVPARPRCACSSCQRDFPAAA